MSLRIEAGELVLHELRTEDTEFVVMLLSRRESQEYRTSTVPTTEQIIQRCRSFQGRAKQLPGSGALQLVVSLGTTPIGEVHVTCNYEATREWEFGYTFLSEHWGRGYATAATKQVVLLLFERLGIHKLLAFCNAENTRSRKLLQRIGMTQEGLLREAVLVDGLYHDQYVYGMLRQDLAMLRQAWSLAGEGAVTGW